MKYTKENAMYGYFGVGIGTNSSNCTLTAKNNEGIFVARVYDIQMSQA